jgi:hypothetical protein
MGKIDIKSRVKDNLRVISWGFWMLQKNVQKFLKIFAQNLNFCPKSQKCFFPRECSYFQYCILRVVIIVFFSVRKVPNIWKKDKNKMSISQILEKFSPEFFADLDKHVFYIYELTR